jgi:hypothetical protein
MALLPASSVHAIRPVSISPRGLPVCKPIKIMLFVLLAVCGSVSSARAQFDTATVLGTVRDNTGGVVPGATVTLTGLDTGISSTKVTDENGNFEFTTVRIGRYKVTAELTGFSVALADNVQATVGARQRVDLQLTPGSMQETVEVVGAATRLETDTSERGQVISATQVVALPLNGREYSSLALLSPGVRLSSLNTGSASTVREGSFNINGLRSTFNNFLLDGIDNNAYGTSNQGFSNQVMQPSPDAVAEFRVVTNNMSAEYGRSAGGTINVSYRSGTNRYSGAGWEFLRDTSMNATGFFKPVNGEKPPLSRDQFGGVFGGPIIKNKAFFFADYEGFRQTRQNVAFQSIPTLDQRKGILALDVVNPVTGQLYPAGTAIPMTAFAQKVLSGLPTPTSAGTSNNYSILQEFTNDNDKMNVKGDLQFSPSLSGFARYGYRDADIIDNPPLPLPSGGGGNGLTYVTNKQFVAGFTWARSSTSLLEGRFGWSRTVAGKSPLSLGTPDALAEYGISGLPTDPRITGGLPTQTVTPFSDFGRQATNPQWQYPEVFNPKLNYTFVTGRHSLKAGYEFQHINTEVQDVNPLYGRDTYSGQITKPATAAANTLYNLSDFMFGFRSQYALSNILIANMRQEMHFGYVQDDFRMNNQLTLNLGMRYEYATPHWERDNVLTNYDPVANAMISAKDGSIQDRSTIKPDRNNFGPRAGFAWTVLPETVVRGGYGLSYVHFHRAGGANLLPINGPQVINAVVNQTDPRLGSFVTTQQGYPTTLTDPSRFNPLAANITYMPEDYHSSQVQSYFISVQREIARNMIVDLAYVGNRADDLLLLANYNQATPNNSAGTIPLANRRPIAGFADITYAFNGGKSRYNSLQFKYNYRPRGGLMFLNAFTWSKAKDNGAGSLEGPAGNFPAPQDFRNLDADYGTSAYDQPLNNTTSAVWELPFGPGKKWLSSGAAGAILGGWTLSGINTMTSGEVATLQYTPSAAFQVSGIQQDFRGANNYRPNQNGDPYGDTNSVSNYLSRDTVTLPTDPSQPFGNAPRNSVRGPWFWQMDVVAAKDFRLPIGTDTRAQFRLEAFNLLNRTNLRAPNANRSAGNYGTITSAYDARQLQLGFKVTF